MRRFFFTILSIATMTLSAAAQVAPVKQDPAAAMAGPDQMTISDCLGILAGLSQLDAGERRIIQEGKPTESVETIRFKLLGKASDAVTHNIFILGPVQQEAQVANRRAQLEIGKGEAIKPGSRENLELDSRLTDYTARPCRVDLDHIREDDLDLKKNAISASIRALLWKITDKSDR